MGLFGPKKEKTLPKVSDIFSREELKKIKKVVGHKYNSTGYGKYDSMAETLLDVAKNPDKQYTKKEWRSVIYAVGGFTRLEPEIAPILKQVIGRFRKFK